MRVQVVVQAHPARLALAGRRLLPRLGQEPIIVTDPDPLAEVKSAWRTYRRALEVGLAGDPTHLLVVQDDATTPCEDLQREATRVAVAQPTRLISLYHGFYPRGGAVAAVRCLEELPPGRGGYAQGDTSQWVPAVALVWPAALARDALASTPSGETVEASSDDAVLGAYLRQRRLGYLVAVPNLVQHPDDVPSLFRYSTGLPYRRSVGLAADPAALTWD